MSHRRRGANHDAWEDVSSSSSSDEEEERVVEEEEERLDTTHKPSEVPRRAKAEHARTSAAVPATSQKKKTRSEKNRPLEVSSRAPVSAGRERKSSSSSGSSAIITDPRFNDLTGSFNAEGFAKAYSFLNDYRESEMAEMNKEMAKLKKKGKIAEAEGIQAELKRMQSQDVARRRLSLKHEAMKDIRQKQREQVAKTGKMPYFPKQSEVRKRVKDAMLRETAGKGKGAQERVMAKRQKREAAKEKKHLPNRLFDLLCDLDAACCRLCEDGRKSTANTQPKELLLHCQRLGVQLQQKVADAGGRLEGGVYSSSEDPLWVLSQGEDVDLVGPPSSDGIRTCLGAVKSAIEGLQELCTGPRDERFVLAHSDWLPEGQLSVFTTVDLPANTLVSSMDGYWIHSSHVSNPHYNATVGGTGGNWTIDPTDGNISDHSSEAVCLEWRASVGFRINEPPPGRSTNCQWKIRKEACPQIYTSSVVEAGSELFIYYGDGYAEARDYVVADGCHWAQTEDSYDSDIE
ncbi:rRNA bioproteinsis protein rrp36 [Perkinsus olseni]|uniref:rRNA biogenesis protein RRP36 n=1 Tax=Perkinsus olseni TaxID=32597 RepID=A0A7J6LLK9_PEROL|nr:rRNA bioproteinsis protein rrp36 [Perkinsus olseni]KAF4664410.1 rRNA bioproteinsis protein rrp36 [Perkinsus olseni]